MLSSDQAQVSHRVSWGVQGRMLVAQIMELFPMSRQRTGTEVAQKKGLPPPPGPEERG